MGRRRDEGDSGRELRATFAELYDANAANLLGWFQSRTYSGEVAADLVAETFAVAIAEHHRYDGDRGAHGAWLWGIARNLLKQFHRSGAVDARARARLAMRTPVAHDDDLDAIDAAVDASALRTHLEAALDQLSPDIADAVRARVIDGLAYDEVAARCGCSVGAARVRVSRALAGMLDQLDDLPVGEVNR